MRHRIAALWLLLFLLCGGALSAQIIYNGNFSLHGECPGCTSHLYFDELSVRGTGWTRATLASPDYFHYCATGVQAQHICSSSLVKVPNNKWGQQNDASPNVPTDEAAYAGVGVQELINLDGVYQNYREYIQQHLSTPLQAGVPYKVSFKVSLAENYSTPTLPDGLYIGAYLSNTEPPPSIRTTTDVLPYTPQIYLPASPYTSLNNTTDWIPVEGIIIPTEDIHYITIGNFRKNVIKSWYPSNQFAAYYFYIDDVEIIPVVQCGCYFDVTYKRKSFDPCCYTFTIKSEGSCPLYKIEVQDGGNVVAQKSFTVPVPSNGSTTIDYCLPTGQETGSPEIVLYTRESQSSPLIELCRKNINTNNEPEKLLSCERDCFDWQFEPSPWKLKRTLDPGCCWEVQFTVNKEYDIKNVQGMFLDVVNGDLSGVTFAPSSAYWSSTIVAPGTVEFTNPEIGQKLTHGKTYTVGKICIDGGGVKNIQLGLLDGNGARKCFDTQIKTIDCSVPNNCCEAFDAEIRSSRSNLADGSCLSQLYITKNKYSGCNITRIVLGINGTVVSYTPSNGEPYFTIPDGPVVEYQTLPFKILNIGQGTHTVYITFYMLKADGTFQSCQKTLTFECEDPEGSVGSHKQGELKRDDHKDGAKASCIEWISASMVKLPANCIEGTGKSVVVVDATGRIINAISAYNAAADSFTVDFSGLPSGAYFLRITSDIQSEAYPILWLK